MREPVRKEGPPTRTFGHWRVRSTLGQGSYGTVYSVVHTHNPIRIGALKILHKRAIPGSRALLHFRNEINSTRRIHHPNVVKIIESGIINHDECYIVMEFLNGNTLAQLLEQRTRLSISESLGIGLQIAKAVQAAHRVGVIHRDLKPSNIMIISTNDEVPILKVIDFGIAKIVTNESHSRRFTPTGELKGSLPYMAPEQFSAPHGIDDKIDIYSLGTILYQCITGTLPFNANSDADWQKCKEEGMVVPPGNAQKAVSDLIIRMLCKDRSERPSASDVVANLENCINKLTSHSEDGIAPNKSSNDRKGLIYVLTKYRTIIIATVVAIFVVAMLDSINHNAKLEAVVKGTQRNQSEASHISTKHGDVYVNNSKSATAIVDNNEKDGAGVDSFASFADMLSLVEPINPPQQTEVAPGPIPGRQSIDPVQNLVGVRRMALSEENKAETSVAVAIDGDLRGIEYGDFEVVTSDNQVSPCGRANREELGKPWTCNLPSHSGTLTSHIRFRGYTGNACEIATGLSRQLSSTKNSDVIHLRIQFKPRLLLSARLLNSSAMARPKPFESREVLSLDFSVRRRSEPDSPFSPITESCHSNIGEYYLEPGTDAEITAKVIDGAIFDGWTDSLCPKTGQCMSRRMIEHITEDVSIEARYLSWLCTNPETFCLMSPDPERYRSVLDGRSAMSAMALGDNDLWLVGHNGTPAEYGKPEFVKKGVILHWNGNEWTEYFLERRLWDVAGYVTASPRPSESMAEVYAIGDEGIFRLSEDRFVKETDIVGTGIFASPEAGVWAVGKTFEGKPRLLRRSGSGEWKAVAEEMLKSETRTLHSVVGNRNHVFASGKNGLLIEVKLPTLQPHAISSPIDISENSRFYAQAINDRSDLFFLASYEDKKKYPKIVHYDAQKSTFKDTDLPLNTLFGAWFNQNSSSDYEIWMTGSYAPIWRCGFPSVISRACESVKSNVPVSSSLRGFAGTSVKSLWAIGYDRENAQIRLARYRDH